MKLPPVTAERLKFAGGALVVLAAAVIMFPGFVTVALGLWRLLLILIIAGGACLALAYGTRRLSRWKNKTSQQPAINTSSDNSSG